MASVFVSLVFALRSAARSRAALHHEILALRHQVSVLNRSRRSRLRLTAADRVLWAWLSQAWSGWRALVSSSRTPSRLAPTRVPPVLDVEESVPCGSSSRGFRGPRVDSSNGHGESALGCTADSWGTAEAGDLGESDDRREVHAATRKATITAVANVPRQPCRPDRGCRFLRRARSLLSREIELMVGTAGLMLVERRSRPNQSSMRR